MIRPTVKIGDTHPNCLICRNTKHSTLHHFDEWDILQCEDCTLVYVDPVPSSDQLIDTAENTHSGSGASPVKNYHRVRNLNDPSDPMIESYTNILNIIEQQTLGRTLLDIGCGEGTFSAVATRRGWSVKALDASATATNTARNEYNLNVITSVFPSQHSLDSQLFDAIVMLDVLEHIPNPVDAITVARNLLKNGGVLYINSPNHESLLCWTIDVLGKLNLPTVQSLLRNYYHPAHVMVFNPKSLTKLVTTCGLNPQLIGTNSPILDRLELPFMLRIFVYVLTKLSKLLRLESRVWTLSRL